MTGGHLSRREVLLYYSAASLTASGSGGSAAEISGHKHEIDSNSWYSTDLQFFTAEDAADIESIAALIIPTDDTPGAREAGVVNFIDKALATFDQEKQAAYHAGLAEVRQHLGIIAPGRSHLSQLSPEQQAALMQAIVHSEFFSVIRTHTIMGFFGNPSYGGNRNKEGWKLIGFEDQFMFQAPFGYYDADSQKD